MGIYMHQVQMRHGTEDEGLEVERMTEMTPEQIRKLLKEHPEILDWHITVQSPAHEFAYPKGLLKLPKLSEEECESLRKAIEESDAIPQIYLPPRDNSEEKAVVKDIDSESVETMLAVILDEIRLLRKAIEGKKEDE